MEPFFLLCFLFSLLGQTMGMRYISPVGPRMCASLCRSTYGCSLYIFSSSHLTCHLVNDHYTWEGSAVVMENTQFQGEASARANQTCPMFSTIFRDRGGNICCAKRTNDVVYRAETMTLRPRLLVTEISNKQLLVYQLFMDDFSNKIYPNLILKGVNAMIYFPPSRSLVVSQPSRARLAAISVDTNIVRTIKEPIKCRSMAIDNQKNVLLLAVANPKPAIYTVAGNGSRYSLLFHFEMTHQERVQIYPTAIVMDARRNLVYICLREKIVAGDINGKTQVLQRGRTLYGMTLNAQEDVLYYSDNIVIKTLYLRTERTRRVNNVGVFVWGIVYYKEHIHVSTSRHFYSIPTTNTNKPFDWNLPRRRSTWIMCALP